MASSTHLAFLEGPDLIRLPAYNSGVISSGLSKLFGIAVVHGIVHARVGIPFLPRDMSRNARNNKNGKKENIMANLANMAKMTILPESPTWQSTKQ